MSDDLISRQEAIDVLSLGKEILSRVLDDTDVVGADREKYSWGIRLIESNIEDIKELPSASSEIICCRDCKHRGEKPIADGRYWCERHYAFMHYCSDAERSENETT